MYRQISHDKQPRTRKEAQSEREEKNWSDDHKRRTKSERALEMAEKKNDTVISFWPNVDESGQRSTEDPGKQTVIIIKKNKSKAKWKKKSYLKLVLKMSDITTRPSSLVSLSLSLSLSISLFSMFLRNPLIKGVESRNVSSYCKFSSSLVQQPFTGKGLPVQLMWVKSDFIEYPLPG